MKSNIRQIFRNPNFLVGFVIMSVMLLLVLFFPLFSQVAPLEMVGTLFNPPGTYIAKTDVIDADDYNMKIDTMLARLETLVSAEDVTLMLEWFEQSAVDPAIAELDPADDKAAIIEAFLTQYDTTIRIPGTSAYRKSFTRMHIRLENVLNAEGFIISVKDESAESGLREVAVIEPSSFANVRELPNRRFFPLGTDNFGRDTFAEMVSAMGNSLLIGLLAGVLATAIGLLIGLFAGYVGGLVDNILTFITNIFTVIPSFVILVLISVSLNQAARSIWTTALVIGITSWPWTARSVRSQTLTLKNRDHVNISKLSGYSTVKIILNDILPYVASYVVMAFILQIASAIGAEAQLAMIGLGPSTASTATLGLMMSWATQFQAPMSNAWWAFLPVILTITFISFSLNMMNTGLDQVFNPTLR